MTTVTKEYKISEAKSQLSHLVSQAQDFGIESIVTVYNRPAAKIVPIDEATRKKASMKGALAQYAAMYDANMVKQAWADAAVRKHETSRR